jgi:hypothetical protein
MSLVSLKSFRGKRSQSNGDGAGWCVRALRSGFGMEENRRSSSESQGRILARTESHVHGMI